MSECVCVCVCAGAGSEGVEEGEVSEEAVLAWEQELVSMDAKVVDLGNACWTHKHFSEEIQTRQVCVRVCACVRVCVCLCMCVC